MKPRVEFWHTIARVAYPDGQYYRAVRVYIYADPQGDPTEQYLVFESNTQVILQGIRRRYGWQRKHLAVERHGEIDRKTPRYQATLDR